jgi:probable phosphomutase (TIGR03848 family)
VTTFLLIRHAMFDAVGKVLAGRRPGCHLNDAGRSQVVELCDLVTQWNVGRVYSSPLERAWETAGPLAERFGLMPVVAEELSELDFGTWTGRTFQELASDPQWALFNSYRSGTRVPGGELMLETQARIVGFMLRLRDEHPGETVALVSHGDVIRAALAFHLGMPLDLFGRIEISPASVSVVRLHDTGPEVLGLNARPPSRV